MRRNDKLICSKVKDIAYCPYNSAVMRNSAAEGNRLADWKRADDGCLVIADHRIAQTKQNVRRRYALLLSVYNIGLGEYRTSSGKAWY